jgi:N4-gp56 family major capsid protein
MANTTFSTLAPGGGADVTTDDAVRYIRDELLSIAEKNMVFAEHAMKVQLPQHNSKTIQFSRYPRLALPGTPAIEGETPTAQLLSVETVSAVVDQWIMVVQLTDLSILTIKHPLIPIVTERLGEAKANLVDREIQKILLAGDNVTFANSRASRALLQSGDTVNSVEMRKIWKSLRRNGARVDGRNYIAIVDPEVSQDIGGDDQFHSAHELKDVSALYNNEIGEWMGFRVMVSNFIPVHTLIADASWTVNQNVAAGSWAGGNNSTLYVKITAVESDFGFETDISNVDVFTDLDDTEKATINFPTTPASGVTYNVYASDTNNTSTDANLRLVSTGNLPSSTLDLTTIITDFPEAADFPVTAPASPGTGVTVHTSFMFGKDAYAMVDLSGDNLRVLVAPAGASKSDPADQRRPLSLKGSFKAVILNEDYLQRLESASAFD